jgi:hypothetical protein
MPSPTAIALTLSQDITALVSLSLETTASIVHDWLRLGLSAFGGKDDLTSIHFRPKSKIKDETGRGLAVVIVGASEGGLRVWNHAKLPAMY